MIRKTILFATLVLVFGGTASAQNWIDQGPFPDSTTFWRGAHGLAVDAQGKVWISQYYPEFLTLASGDTLKNAEGANVSNSAIHVFNPDGTRAMDPITALRYVDADGNAMMDSISWGAPRVDIRGIRADHNGDIIVVLGNTASLMVRLNHITGEVMNRVDFGSERFGSPVAPGIDAAGNIYVAPVAADAPISIYNPDFRWINNVAPNSPGIGRTLEVSADGHSVYWSAFTHRGTYKYHRADEFSQYDSLGLIHEGLIATSSVRHPTTGHVWLGHSGVIEAPVGDEVAFRPGSELTWYALDPEADDAIVDSLAFDSPFTYCGAGLNNRDARSVGFSHDGVYAYVGVWGALQAESRVEGSDECVWITNDNAEPLNRGFVFKKFMRGMVTSIDRDPTEIPDGFTLSQNYPNPFNPQTNIEFELKDAGLATLRVYDMLGREVATLVDEHLVAGKYTATFNATELTSGTYVYQLNVAGHRLSGKMTLVK
ncbi:MAG: T9SS type A sorting domain-containing protein [Bacteroidetes bacterium]|nr:T9SS type A sorting domain-containing protein [Bacteroidota bacterium]